MRKNRKSSSLVTLDDIARRVKVSRVTVSKALRGHPDISDTTARKIRGVATELGYLPNIIARSLSARQSNMIGVVVPRIANFFFGSVIEGIYNTAFGNNYETILTVSQENPDRERTHLQTLVSMRVDGIIISVTHGTRDVGIFEWIRQLGIPLLFVDRTPLPPPHGFSTVCGDDRGGARRAIEHAIHLGYRKIACIGGERHINIGRERQAGFEAAMRAHDLPVEKHWKVGAGFDKQTGYDAILTLHRDHQIPELAFPVTYPVALGVYEAAKKLGLSIPHDMDVIGFGDSDAASVISPALSCVRPPSYELGVKAVELMLKILTHPRGLQEQHLVLPTDLVLRETCMGKNAMQATHKLEGTAR